MTRNAANTLEPTVKITQPATDPQIFIPLGGQAIFAWEISKPGTSLSVTAKIDKDNKCGTNAPNGWTWGEPKYMSGPDGAASGQKFSFDTTAVCKAAPHGMLIGAFVPKALRSDLSRIDLTKTDKDQLLLLQTILSGAFPVGPQWEGIAPFEGFLVLLMNDACQYKPEGAPVKSGYFDNNGAIVVNVLAK